MSNDDLKKLQRFIVDSQQESFEDLKRYVNRKLSVQTDDTNRKFKQLEQKIDGAGNGLKRLEQKVDDMDVKLETVLNHIGKKMKNERSKTKIQLSDHEVRITKLEQTTV